jgi:hypothetical protein
LALTEVGPVCFGEEGPEHEEALAKAGRPGALSHGVKVEVGSTAPAQLVTSPEAEVGVPLRLTVTVTEESALLATPAHSVTVISELVPHPLVALDRADASKVMPGALRLVTVIEEPDREVTIKTMISSGLFAVVTLPIVNEVPELQVPVLNALPFGSLVGLEPSATFWLVVMSAEPVEVAKLSHLPLQEPTTELPR